MPTGESCQADTSAAIGINALRYVIAFNCQFLTTHALAEAGGIVWRTLNTASRQYADGLLHLNWTQRQKSYGHIGVYLRLLRHLPKSLQDMV